MQLPESEAMKMEVGEMKGLRNEPSISLPLSPQPVSSSGRIAHLGKKTTKLMTDKTPDDIQLIEEIRVAVAGAAIAPGTSAAAVDEEPDKKKKRLPDRNTMDVDQLLDDIEQDVMILQPEDLGYQKNQKKPERSDSPEIVENIDLTTALKAKPGKKKKK